MTSNDLFCSNNTEYKQWRKSANLQFWSAGAWRMLEMLFDLKRPSATLQLPKWQLYWSSYSSVNYLINSDLLTILLMNAVSYLPHLSLLLCSPPLLRSNLTHSTLLHRERGTITAGRPLRLNTCLFLIMALWVKTTSFDPYSSNLLNVAFTLVVNQDLLLKYLFNNYNLTFRGLAIVSISYCITDYLLSHQALLWWWRVRESSFNLLPLF